MIEKSSCGRLISYRLLTPIGEMIMEICVNGLHVLSQSSHDDKDFKPDLSIPVSVQAHGDTKISADVLDPNASSCITWLKQFFSDPTLSRNTATPTFCFLKSTGKQSFRERVWLTLAEKVGPGKTISYGELASLSGSIGAAQAVGTAMASNPIQLIVPCHRVVRNDKAVGKYGFGRKNKVKLWLLNHEGIAVDSKGFINT